MRRILAAASFMTVLLVSCGDSVPSGSPSRSPTASPTSTSSPAEHVEFDGTIHGWRIAPNQVLEAEFGNDLRNIDLDCEPKRVTSKTPFDVELTYFPESALERSKPNVDKWVCGSQGLSASYNYSLKVKPFPVVGQFGELRIDRVAMGRRAYFIGTAWADRVSACTVAGLPAVCYRNEAEGQVLILVIEDDTLDPLARVLLVDASGLPFDELVQMIEGIV